MSPKKRIKNNKKIRNSSYLITGNDRIYISDIQTLNDYTESQTKEFTERLSWRYPRKENIYG